MSTAHPATLAGPLTPQHNPRLAQVPMDPWHLARTRMERLAWFWALAFAATGIGFVAWPEHIGAGLAAAGRWLHLSGQIDVQPGTLWHVLALSLMVSVTGLAMQCAQRPLDEAPYRLLMAAKIASTLGFAWLALDRGSIWLLAAATDGFVALSLAVVHQPLAKTAVSGLARRHRGQHPSYEVWFGKVDLGPDRALWFRYTLLDGTTREAAVWALLFDGGVITAARDVSALHGPAASEQRSVEIGANWLDHQGARGQAGEITWDLQWQDRGARLDHVPAWMVALGVAKSQLRSPLLDLRVTGTVTAGGRQFTVQGATGMVGHIHGKRSAHGWAWAHCNLWDGGEEAVFEGLSAQVALAGRISKPLTSLVFIAGGVTYRFGPAASLWRTTSTYGHGIWTFVARSGGVELRGRAVAPGPERVALVRYTDSDGTHQWCENSKLAYLQIQLIDPKRGIDKVWTASHSAAFEIVSRDLPNRPETLI